MTSRERGERSVRRNAGGPVNKQALHKGRTQRVGVAARGALWWQGGWQERQQVPLTPMWTRWIAEVWLPLMSGRQHVSHTRCPRRQAKL